MTQAEITQLSNLDVRLGTLFNAGRQRVGAARTFSEIVHERVIEDPDRVVVIESDRAVTRAEMLDAACRLGGALVSLGIAPGASIGFQLPNWWEACVINLTAALFGYRIVPLLTIYRRAELGHILPACGVEVIFVPQQLRKVDFPAQIASLLKPPSHVFTVRGDASQSNTFEQLLEHAPAPVTPSSADDAKFILFTSGSTGYPKGVIHTHSTIDALIRRTAAFWQTGPDDIFYVPSPIGHIGGSIYAFEFPWITGCKTILAEAWNADEAVKQIDAHQVTFMAGATPFLSGLIEASQRAGTALPSLRRFVCGGASVSPELVRTGLKTFKNAVISRAYGSTEVPLVCPGAQNRMDAEAHAETDGECTAELRLLDDAGQAVAKGETGEIAVRAPQMFLGYLDQADDAGCFTPDGFFKMGDLGRVVDGRFLEITGRKKDIIIRKGENISPLEIENALARHDGVRQSAVVGVPDPERGEMVVAFVLPKDGCEFGFSDMISHLDGLGMAKQKFPERLEIVSLLPMNAVGKVEKVKLKALATDLAKIATVDEKPLRS